MEEMRKRKIDRRNQFIDVLEQMQIIKNEIHGSIVYTSKTVVDEADLSLRKLEEFHRELLELQKEKVKLTIYTSTFIYLFFFLLSSDHRC